MRALCMLLLWPLWLAAQTPVPRSGLEFSSADVARIAG